MYLMTNWPNMPLNRTFTISKNDNRRFACDVVTKLTSLTFCAWDKLEGWPLFFAIVSNWIAV